MIIIVTMTTALSDNDVLFELNSVNCLLFVLFFSSKIDFVLLSSRMLSNEKSEALESLVEESTAQCWSSCNSSGSLPHKPII